MANTLNLGTDGNWAVKKDSLLAYNSENGNYKPLPFDFTRASSATVVNKAGLIETVGSGEPRIDFKDNTKGALLLEPQRMNSLPYSEDFSNPNWLKTSVTTTPNSEIAPDGTLTACKLDYSASTSARMAESINPAAGTYTFSVYLRSVSGSGDFKIRLQGSSSVNLTVSLTEEWKRFEIESDYDGTVALLPYIGYYINDSYLQEVYAWGAQLEQGSYATSYIPTSGSAVTRIADVCNNGGNDQVINSTEGVLYAEISALANDGTSRQISLSSGSSATNKVSLNYTATSNQVQAFIRSGGSISFNETITLSDSTNLNKIALKYKSNDFALFVNGFKVASDLSGNAPTALSVLDFDDADGTSDLYGNVKDLRLYNTALTDNELIALTT